MKTALVCLFICSLVALNNAQNPFGFGLPVFGPSGLGPSGLGPSGFGPGTGMAYGFSQAQYYKNWALQFAAQRLAVANLPQDLQDAADQGFADAEVGLQACEDLAQTAPWQYNRCALVHLRTALKQITAIEKEAAARTASTESASVEG